jgi:uncharacterized membrane protein YoaK (UPF0700 family)
MSAAPPTSSVRDVIVAIALTLAGGFVDAFGFLTLSGVYTANMSGNTVLVGVRVLSDGSTALLHAFTIAMFVLGLLASGVIIKAGLRRRIRLILALAMTVEALFLLVFLAWGHEFMPVSGSAHLPLYPPIALAAMAMGIQNTSLRMAGVLGVYTTHVTGTITRFSEFVIDWSFARRDCATGADEAGARVAASRRGALTSAGLWSGFLTGAVLASYLHPRWQIQALLVPLAIVVAVGIADAASPLTRTAEPDA